MMCASDRNPCEQVTVLPGLLVSAWTNPVSYSLSFHSLAGTETIPLWQVLLEVILPWCCLHDSPCVNHLLPCRGMLRTWFSDEANASGLAVHDERIVQTMISGALKSHAIQRDGKLRELGIFYRYY